MQPLGPPEKVALYQKTSIHRTTNECTITSRTGCRKPRKAFQAFCPCPAIALVGTRRRLVPTNLCYCKMVKTCLNHEIRPTEKHSERTNVQVVSSCGDEYKCPRGNGQLFVDLSRSAHDGLRQRQDIIFGGLASDIECSRVKSQGLLCGSGNQSSIQPLTVQTDYKQTFPTATKYGMESKSFTPKSLSPLTLTFSNVSVISARSLS